MSRWETGSNMPDQSILVELADYADNEKENLAKRIMMICISGLCAMLVAFVMLVVVGFEVLPVTDYVIGVAFGIGFGSLLASVLYLSGAMAKICNTSKLIQQDRSCWRYRHNIVWVVTNSGYFYNASYIL